ncbi:MAG: FAD-binding protein [Actinobacteria bacterium]|nr:FAD-binding protein [Actinomycetota bacterium]
MSKSSDVLIVGAGLAGINAALKLQAAGRSTTGKSSFVHL